MPPPPVALLAALAAAALLTACSNTGADATSAQRRQAVPVRAATAIERDVPIQLRAIGTVEAYASVDVKARVDGQVAEVHFREGQEVHKGDLLFTIDPRPFEASLRQAEANLARHRAEAENARVEAQRLTQLLAQQIVSQDEFDQAQTQAAAMRSTVDAEQAAVDNAKLQLLYCRITSPIEGRIGRILVNLGNVVKADESTLAVVNQIRPIYVGFSVPQLTLGVIRQRAEGAPLRVEADLGDGQQVASGELSFIDNQVNTDSGTVRLKGLFSNEHEQLWPGQFVDTVLTLSTQPRAVVIPSAAVQIGQQGPYVFVIGADRTVELRAVRTGEDLGEEMVIADNLHAGERVVTDGHFLIAPGMTVEIKESAADAPPATPPAPTG